MIRADDPIVFVSAFAPGENGAIHAYRFDGDSGQMTLLNRTSDIEHPFFMVVSPDGRFLYAIDTPEFGGEQNDFVAAYSINQKNGELTRLNRQSTGGRASCYLDIDASGQAVVVANYSSGDVAAIQVRNDGSLGDVASFVRHSGSSIDPRRQTGPNAHCLEISPDNRFALAADLGIDKVLIYRIQTGTGKLTVNEAQPFAKVEPGSGPRHLTFHPSGKYVYLINELKNTVALFDYDGDIGTLKHRQTIPTLPADFTGTSHCADLKITPNGQFLYGTNRGHDSIAIYRIAEDGMLSLVKLESSRGSGPQNLFITPDGRWLMCANMPGSSVVVFEIDSVTGVLNAVGEPLPVQMASCIRWLSQ